MQVHQRGGAGESIDSLLHRCDEGPERGETTRREKTSPEVAAPDGDVGGDDNQTTRSVMATSVSKMMTTKIPSSTSPTPLKR